MRIPALAGLAALAGLTACSHHQPADPAVPAKGRHTLLTPVSGSLFHYYSSASQPGPDQPTWLAASYLGQPAGMLLVRIDSAGQAMSSRLVAYPADGEVLSLAALADGSVMGLGGNNGQPMLFKLAPDGSPGWSKALTTNQGPNLPFGAGAIAALGQDALYYGTIGGFNQRYFARVASDGTVQPYVSYTFPVSQPPFSNATPAFKPLPAGAGAVMLEQLDDAVFLLTSVDATGHLRWLRRLTVAGLVATPQSSEYFDVAASPTNGHLAVLLSSQASGTNRQSQLLRFSAAGDLLGTTTLAGAGIAATTYYQHLAMGPQDEVAWLMEGYKALYYYAVNAQGQVVAAQQVANVPANSSVIKSYGLVGVGQQGAYGFGSFAGAAPTYFADASINFLHFSAGGQAGCPLVDAPALTSTASSGTQVAVLPVPTAGTLANSTASTTLYSSVLPLVATQACQ